MMKGMRKLIEELRHRGHMLPNVGELIQISLGPFNPDETDLPEGKVEVYSGGCKFVTRLEPITKIEGSYFAQCSDRKSHIHRNIQTASLAKTGSWLAWCQKISVKKNGVWKTKAAWKSGS